MPTAISWDKQGVRYQYESLFRVFVVNKSDMLTLLVMFLSHSASAPQSGSDVVLTIDANIKKQQKHPCRMCINTVAVHKTSRCSAGVVA